MFKLDEIVQYSKEFNIECTEVGQLIDTSHGDHDQRYNYPINDSYFMKITNDSSMTKEYLEDINRLHDRYDSIGVYCPRLKRHKNNDLLYEFEKEGFTYKCYVEEKAKFETSPPREHVDYEFKKEVLVHVGKLANKHSNLDLSDTMSMWSLIELAPHNIDRDEKQENFDSLIECLEASGYQDTVKKLLDMNERSRFIIKEAMKTLPRCVYQGDLNNSNVLIDDQGSFSGLIDFNLSGTEININCFLNEAMYFIKEDDFETLSGKEIYNKTKIIQADLFSAITSHYALNHEEMEMIKDYNKIIYSSFWPNVTLMKHIIEEGQYKDKVIEFLECVIQS